MPRSIGGKPFALPLVPESRLLSVPFVTSEPRPTLEIRLSVSVPSELPPTRRVVKLGAIPRWRGDVGGEFSE